MNWGKATVVILVVFVLFIGSMSVYMFRAPADDYDHQYYEDGLNYDRDYNREEQVTKDHAEPLIEISRDSIKFIFPQIISGQVKFMRPSSDARDGIYPIDNKDGAPVRLSTAHLEKGKWQLSFNWKSGNKAYLYHQEVYIK